MSTWTRSSASCAPWSDVATATSPPHLRPIRRGQDDPLAQGSIRATAPTSKMKEVRSRTQREYFLFTRYIVVHRGVVAVRFDVCYFRVPIFISPQVCAPIVPTTTARSRTRYPCCPARARRAAAVRVTNHLRPPYTLPLSSSLINLSVSVYLARGQSLDNY